MIANAFQLDPFMRNPESFARVVAPGDLFTFLNPSITLPSASAALMWRDSSQPTLVSGGRMIEADGVRELFFVKSLPIELEYQITKLLSKDGYDFSANVTMSVQVVAERAELEELRRQLLGSRNRADRRDLARHCEETVRSALTEFARQRDAAALAGPQSWDDFDAVLAEYFQPLGFASGLALGRDPRVTFDSPAFADARRRLEDQARRQERQSAEEALRTAAQTARQKHLADLSAMLEQLKATATKNPAVAVKDLIKSFDITRRGELYRGLMSLGTAAASATQIIAVAGQELLWFDPAHPDKPIRRKLIADGLGPLRSVRLASHGDRTLIFIGARYGVHVLDGDELQAYSFAERGDLRGGVNAAALAAGRLYATHSEAGLTSWGLGEPSSSMACLANQTKKCKSVRDVQISRDDRIWFATDERIVGWSPDSASEPVLLHAPAPVASLVVTEDRIIAGLDNGAVVSLLVDAPDQIQLLRSAGSAPISSLEWLSGGGIPRLLIADNRPYLTLAVLGDTYHAEYRWKQPIRWGFGSKDWIAGVNDSRDQLVLWRSDTPEEPTATIAVGRLCGHSIQDVAIEFEVQPGPLMKARAVG